MQKALEEWDPSSDPQIESDPYKTLFIGRLVGFHLSKEHPGSPFLMVDLTLHFSAFCNVPYLIFAASKAYETSERKLADAFEPFGPIKTVSIPISYDFMVPDISPDF